MRWRNAWVLMRKDLDEFKKQKLLIGSIIALPIIFGVIIPLSIIGPIALISLNTDEWDVPGLVERDANEHYYMNLPFINETLENASSWYDNKVLHGLRLINAKLNTVVIDNCIIINSTIYNSTIKECDINNSYFENCLIYHSSGQNIDGKNIVTIGSSLEYLKKKDFDFMQFLPWMLNFILIMFITIAIALPTQIASYSLVGEKNNKSLEPLLATPTTDGELLAGKILSAFVPTMAAVVLAFILCIVIVSSVFITTLGFIPIAFDIWILSIVLLVPTACLISILACVFISSKVKDVRAAQQLGGFVVMPIIVVMIAFIVGALIFSHLAVIILSTVFGCVDIGLFYFIKGIFNREDILVNWA